MAAQIELPSAVEMAKKPDTFMVLIDKAIQQGLAADALGKLLDHYERWQRLEAKKAYDEAMQMFKASAPDILKKQKATVQAREGKQGYSYRYADLDNCCEVLDGP